MLTKTDEFFWDQERPPPFPRNSSFFPWNSWQNYQQICNKICGIRNDPSPKIDHVKYIFSDQTYATIKDKMYTWLMRVIFWIWESDRLAAAKAISGSELERFILSWPSRSNCARAPSEVLLRMDWDRERRSPSCKCHSRPAGNLIMKF